MTKIELNFFGFAKELTVSDDTEKIAIPTNVNIEDYIHKHVWGLASFPYFLFTKDKRDGIFRITIKK